MPGVTLVSFQSVDPQQRSLGLGFLGFSQCQSFPNPEFVFLKSFFLVVLLCFETSYLLFGAGWLEVETLCLSLMYGGV